MSSDNVFVAIFSHIEFVMDSNDGVFGRWFSGCMKTEGVADLYKLFSKDVAFD